MVTLIPGNNGTFYIDYVGDGVIKYPYSRNDVLAVFNTDNTKLRIFPRYDTGRALVNESAYTELKNGKTNAVFASLDELIAFVASYIMAGAGSDTTAQTNVFSIVAVPAGENEKAAGNTLQDNRLIGANLRLASLVINTDTYTGNLVSADFTTGTIGLNPDNPAAFSVGDTVVITVITF